MDEMFSPADISAVVCTMNSISGIERCLVSLREVGVGQIIVVDAHSTDGTREVAFRLADHVLDDEGKGLGSARNIGIAHTTGQLVLNMGSDNVMPPGQVEIMINTLIAGNYQGVSAQTHIEGENYPSRGLNAWRKGRFRPGEASIIGTPTLFVGDLLRMNPYDPHRRFSDDSELCERWRKDFKARFAISSAKVLEIGKTSWEEVAIRCRMYGISDEEIYRLKSRQGWSRSRKIQSLLHPLRADVITPLRHLQPSEAIQAMPFLTYFAAMRYRSWLSQSQKLRRSGVN
jgi:glycosyltransferase involved in cell wall biosynthesis